MSRTAQRPDRIARRQATRCQRVDLRLTRLGLFRQTTVPLRAPWSGSECSDQHVAAVSRLLHRQLATIAHQGRWLN